LGFLTLVVYSLAWARTFRRLEKENPSAALDERGHMVFLNETSMVIGELIKAMSGLSIVGAIGFVLSIIPLGIQIYQLVTD